MIGVTTTTKQTCAYTVLVATIACCRWETIVWVSNFIHNFLWDVITFPCSNFNGWRWACVTDDICIL